MPEASLSNRGLRSPPARAHALQRPPLQVTTFLKHVLTFVNDAASAKPADRVAQYHFGENVLVRRNMHTFRMRLELAPCASGRTM